MTATMQVILANVQCLAKCLSFSPKIDDKVEFESDKQTEKGPSSGTVTKVDKGKVIVEHSDHPGEEFAINKLEVKRFNPRTRSWLMF